MENLLHDSFYIDDHAALYGLLAKHAEALCGQAGYDASARATVLYGKERGVRMAMRAIADGAPLTFQSYFLYKEWADTKNWSLSSLVSVLPEYHHRTTVCGWNETWRKFSLERYGALYCTYIDASLVKGFNPELALHVNTCLSHGHAYCDFNWGNVGFTSSEDIAALEKKARQIAPKSTKDFLYHTAHVLSALRRTYYLELGVISAKQILINALNDYVTFFGPEKEAALTKEAAQDFLVV